MQKEVTNLEILDEYLPVRRVGAVARAWDIDMWILFRTKSLLKIPGWVT